MPKMSSPEKIPRQVRWEFNNIGKCAIFSGAHALTSGPHGRQESMLGSGTTEGVDYTSPTCGKGFPVGMSGTSS